MKNTKASRHLAILTCIGLLITTIPLLLLRSMTSLPDFSRGLITGVGCGVMIAGLIKYKRAQRSGCKIN